MISSLSCPISDEQHEKLDANAGGSHSLSTLDRMMLVLYTTTLAFHDTNYYPRWKTLCAPESAEYLERNFKNIGEECRASGRWKPFRDAVHNHLFCKDAEQQQQQRGKSSPDDETTQKSWGSPYIGDTHDLLKKTILNHCLRTDKAEIDSLTLSIVQSSGTGKSRMMDELAKTLPVVFLNVRPLNNDDEFVCFPAADHEVRSYLAYGKESYHSFLYALFEVLQETLDEKVGEERIHWTFAEKLRYLMTHEQRYSEQGTLRTEFYDKVIKKAKTLREKPVVYDDLYIKANALVSSLPFSDEIPLVLAIDEAHCLATDISGVEAELINLRRQLSKIVICSRIITVLISTSGEIQKFRPPQAISPGPTARRLIRGHQVLPPFTAIGFDHFARGMVKENFLMLDEIITDRFMCQFGRPLFGSRYNNGTYPIQQDIVRYAAQKLRGGGVMPRELSFSAMLACLASRLALQFNPTSLNQQLQQVEQHLRLCITMTADMETAITVAASEPIVAEGSAYMLCHFREQKKMPQMLREVLLGTPSIDLGHRGETMGLLLLTMARDEIVYPPEDPYLSLNNPEGPELRSIPLVTFIQTLLVVDNLTEALPTSVADPTKNLPFGETFRNSRIHFNHFIKVTDSKTINRHYLWKVATRGAGILCADRQLGIDAILIFILDCKKPLGPDNIGVLLIQDKNDAGFELPYNDYLNDVMNPYDLGIFDNDKDQCYVPLIRMVFALASSKSGAYAIKPPMDRPRRETTGTSTPKQMYTAYDFWCAGATRDTFPLIGDDERVFRDILHRDPFWPASYKPLNGEPMEIEAVKRSLHPASRADNGHWSFCEDLRMLASAEDTATEILDMPDTAADEDSSVPQGKKKRKRTAKKRQRLN